jgi:DNA-directed RNA polymerase subunit M/transcription elongation factor TFIIS
MFLNILKFCPKCNTIMLETENGFLCLACDKFIKI